MNVSIKFLGAAGSVTGSKYLLRLDEEQILVDCGLFQGHKELRLRNWAGLPIDINNIGTVIITHAHIDHCGYLPRLVKDGFKGKILCTKATAELMPIMLKDAARLQEEEADFAFRQGYSKHSKPEPLFTVEDAEAVKNFIHGVNLHQACPIGKKASIRFFKSGHILGAASVEMSIIGERQSKKILFSGDIGRFKDPVMCDPELLDQADAVVMESTYGDRGNPSGKVGEELASVIHDAMLRGGPIIIPAFAVGRTQVLLFHLQELISKKEIPELPVFVDSPMAISVTNLYEHHPEWHKIEVAKEHNELISIFDSANIHYCNTSQSSKALNNIKKPCIIISASGMCTGGRILHHLFHRLPDPSATILFTGYQAAGTRGRDILDGAPSVKIFGQYVGVRCQVRVVNGLSAHADQNELIQWASAIKKGPKKVFITHGEPSVAKGFSELLKQRLGWDPMLPEYQESCMLFEGL